MTLGVKCEFKMRKKEAGGNSGFKKIIMTEEHESYAMIILCKRKCVRADGETLTFTHITHTQVER